MKKILFIIPFFLWTCGGGGTSSPTEPNNDDDSNSGTNAVSTGGITSLEWNGENINFSWNVSNDQYFERYEIKEYYNGFKTIFSSNNINDSQFQYPMSKNEFSSDKSFSLLIHNKNGSFVESETKTPKLWEIESDIGNTRLREIQKTSDGGFVTFSYDGSWFGADCDPCPQVIKLDSNLNIESSFNVNNPNGYLDVTNDNGYILGLQANGSNSVLVKTDSNGNIEWEKNGQELQGSGDHGGSINDVQTDDDGYLFTISREFGVGKVNLSGDTVWFYDGFYSNPRTGDRGLSKSIKKINSNTFVAVGHIPYQESDGNDYQTAYMVIFNENGNIIAEYFEYNADYFYEIEILSNGDILVIGSLHHDYSQPYRNLDHGIGGYVARFDNQGNMLWNYIREESDIMINFRDAIEKDNGNLIIGGHKLIQSGNSSGNKQAYIVELDSNGNPLFDFIINWSSQNISGRDIIHSIIKDDDDKPIVVTLRDISQRGFGSLIYKLIDF